MPLHTYHRFLFACSGMSLFWQVLMHSHRFPDMIAGGQLPALSHVRHVQRIFGAGSHLPKAAGNPDQWRASCCKGIHLCRHSCFLMLSIFLARAFGLG